MSLFVVRLGRVWQELVKPIRRLQGYLQTFFTGHIETLANEPSERDSVQNFDILWGVKWDHHESENRTLNVI